MAHDVVDMALEKDWSELFCEVIGEVLGGVDAFEFDEVALLGTAVQHGSLPFQWASFPAELRSKSELEYWLRQQEWGGWIACDV